MRNMPRISPVEYRALPLRVHTLLADAPLHDVWAVDLPRKRDGVTLDDLQRVLSQHPLTGGLALPARALFGLRHVLGRVFRLEDQPKGASAASFATGLTAEDRARSSLAPGTPDGQFRVVYRFENERLLEIHNRTPRRAPHGAGDDRGRLSILSRGVRPQGGWITPVYMALIDPFRRWIIYPAMLNHIRAIWTESASLG